MQPISRLGDNYFPKTNYRLPECTDGHLQSFLNTAQEFKLMHTAARSNPIIVFFFILSRMSIQHKIRKRSHACTH